MKRADINEIAGRIAGARVATSSKSSIAVDPYVVALAGLANMVHDYFRARYRYDTCGHAEINAASIAFTNAEADLLNVVIPGRHETIRDEALPQPELPRWWNRLWPWGRNHG